MKLNENTSSRTDDMDRPQPQIQSPPTLVGLPPEILLQIIHECFLDWPPNLEPERTPEGRAIRRDSHTSRLLRGSLRDLTLVNRQFRALAAPYLFESLCISDISSSPKEDKLGSTHQQLKELNAYGLLQHVRKFTISLGCPPDRFSAGQEIMEILSYMQWPTTMRYIVEESASLTVLRDVHRGLTSGRDFEVIKVRQLELSCVPGSHKWDFQFLTRPYVNTERIWLDFNTDNLKPGPDSLALDRLRNLEYVMHRAHPVGPFNTRSEKFRFQSFTAPDGPRLPFLRQLGNTLKHIRHFALYGLLRAPVTEIAPLICDMRSLEQLDITDQPAIIGLEQLISQCSISLHPTAEFDWAIKYSVLSRYHPRNVDRIEAATVFFTTLPNLVRICFVRDQIGVIYQAVRDEATGTLERVDKIGTIQERFRYLKPQGMNSAVWRCGFPNRLDYSLWGCAADSWCRADEAF